MSNQEIRLWARNAIKGNVGFLLLTAFICSVPQLIGGLISFFSPESLAASWEWALEFVTRFMSLGSICVVLKLIRTGEQDLTALAVPFQAPWVGKALTVALLLSLWSAVKAALPDKGLVGLLTAILGLLISTALLPIRYVLFFYPDWPVVKVISEGFQAGYGDFWDILGFSIILGLPLVGICILIALSPFCGILAVPVLIGGVVALVSYIAYMDLAEVKYAIERFSK